MTNLKDVLRDLQINSLELPDSVSPEDERNYQDQLDELLDETQRRIIEELLGYEN